MPDLRCCSSLACRDESGCDSVNTAIVGVLEVEVELVAVEVVVEESEAVELFDRKYFQRYFRSY